MKDVVGVLIACAAWWKGKNEVKIEVVMIRVASLAQRKVVACRHM